MEAQPKLTVRGALGLLRRGALRRYIIGSAISDTGTWMQVTAQWFVLTTLTDSALKLGLASLCGGLPMLLLTPVGGSVADRFDKRRILLLTQYVQIILATALGLLVWKGWLQIWHVYIFAAILGISNSFEMPALSALVPELVEKSQIAGAISLDRSVFHGSRVVGPYVSGKLIAKLGMASAFFANAFSFVALIIAILSLPPRPQGTKEEEAKRTTGIKDGFRYVAGDRPSLAMVSVIATSAVFIFPIITVMMPLYVKDVLGLGAEQYGTLLGASAIGSLVGSLFLIGMPRAKRIPLMMACAAGSTIAVLGLSRGPSFHVATALLILNSLGMATNFGMASTIVQERAPDYLRGRVSAVFMLSFVGLMPIAGLGVTSLSDAIGMRNALAISALCYGLITLTILTRIRKECSEPGQTELQHMETPPPPPMVATA